MRFILIIFFSFFSVSFIHAEFLDFNNINNSVLASLPPGDITYNGSLNICNGSSIVLRAPSSSSYKWQRNGVVIPNATSQNYSASMAGDYTVVVAEGTTNKVTVVVENPQASFTFSPNAQCSSVPIQFTNTSTGASSFSWEFGDGKTSTSQNPTNTYSSAFGNGTSTFTVRLTAKSPAGCTKTATQSVQVKQGPDPALNDFDNPSREFSICNTGSSNLNVTNTSSTSATNTNYSISWGDGTPDFTSSGAGWPVNQVQSHGYNQAGYYDLIFTVTGQNGCVSKKKYTVYRGSNPQVPFNNPGASIDVCTPFVFSIPSQSTTNPAGTVYKVNKNDGTPEELFTSLPPNYTHTFTSASCGASGGRTPNTYYVTIKAENPCGFSDLTIEPIAISNKPISDFKILPDDTVCVNTSVNIQNTSKEGVYVSNSGNCNKTSPVNWKITPSSGWSLLNGTKLGDAVPNNNPATWGSDILQVNFSNPGVYTIENFVRNFCGISDTLKKICVEGPISPTFDVNPAVICTNNSIIINNTTSITNQCKPPVIKWVITKTNSVCTPESPNDFEFISGTSSSSLNPVIKFNNQGVYNVTLSYTNKCNTFTSVPKVITVNSKPQVSISDVPASICLGQNITPTSNAIPCGSTITKYDWLFQDGTPTNSTAQNPGTISFSSPGNKSITLKVSNACGETTANAGINIQQPTSVNAGSDFSVCKNGSAQALTGTPSGGTWSGQGVSGNTFNPSLANLGQNTLTYTFGSGNCTSKDELVATVNPVPVEPLVNPNLTLCQNQSTSPLTATGSNLLWYTTIGGTGSSAAPTPSSSSIGSQTYYVSQTVNGCTSDKSTINVTVNALATAPNITTPINYCQNDPAVPLSASGSSLLWYTTSMGGTGLTTPPTPSTINTGATTYYVSQVTGCGESPRASIVINVTKKPSASISYTRPNICSVSNSATTPNPPIPVERTGDAGGTYTISPNTGLPINASTGELTPSGATPGKYTITYTLTGTGGCKDFTSTATVDVSAAPTATISYDPVCGSDASAQVKLTGSSGGEYTSTAGLTINKNTGAITPTSSTPGSYEVTYTIAPSSPCPGFTTKATVVITKAPQAAISYKLVNLCNVANSATTPNPPIPVERTGDAGGSYTISPNAGLPINASTGELTPSGATPGKYIITYTLTGTGGCKDFTTTATVDVSAAPTATISYDPVCGSDASAQVKLTGSVGGEFTSTAGLTINKNTGAITPTSSTPGSYEVTYTIVPSSPCPGFTTKATVVITKAPEASISYAPANLCNVKDGNSTPNPPIPVVRKGDAGGTYTISPNAGLPINASTGELTPSEATPGKYTITYTLTGTGGCKDFTTTATVDVSAAPTATINYDPACGSDASAQVKFSGSTGGEYTSTSGLTIDKITGAITPTSSTPGNYEVTYTIAPSSPCPGFTTKATVVITKAPEASISYTPANLCNVKDDASTPNPPIPVVRKGDAGGTYTISPNTGLPIDASTGELTPSEATPGKYTITYTLIGTGGCKDFTSTATVDVIAAPTATIGYDPICGSDASAQVKFSGSIGGEYTSTTGLTIDKNTGAITPTSSKPGTYEVTYTIAPSLPCPGFITKTTVVITKAPAATIVYNPSIVCNVDNSSLTPNPDIDVTLTGDNGGVYSIVPNSGLPIDATTGKIIPSNSTAGEYEITYSITGIGGCANFSTSTKITVNDAPKATINFPGSPFCGGISTPQSVSLTGVTTGSFSSSADLSIDLVTGAINPSLSKPGTYTVTYTILPSPPCPGFITSTSVTIDESPKLEFDKISASICSGGTLTYIPTSTVANTVYNWTVKGGALPNNINGPLSGTVASPQKDISISYTNTGTVSETLIIEVTPINPTSSPCSGPVYSLTAIVNPIPPPPKVQDTLRFCQGSVAPEMTAESLPGNTLIWYDENQIKLISAPTPSTNNPDTIYYFVSQTDPNCESPKSKIVVIVNPTPKIIASSFKNPTKCGLPSGSITLTIVDLNNNPIVNTPVFVQYDKFQTIYKVKDTSDASGIVKVDLTAGTYSDISVEAYECSSTKIPDVFILSDPNPPTKPIAGYNPPVCSENELNLSASSATSNLIDPVDYVWVGPAFGSTPDTTRNTVYSFPSANTSYNGTYIVYAIQNNCISLPANFSVNILQSPVKPIITTRAPLCIGDALSLQATSFLPGQNPNPTLNYTWTGPGRGFPVNAPNAQINSVIIKDAGVYTITVFSPATGCSSKTDTLIGIGGYPIVDLGQSPLTLPTGQILDLNPQIVNAAEANILPIKVFEWNPSANISCDDAVCGAPKLAVKNNACYAVKATNIYGCSGSDTICIKVFCENTQVFIPNAFVPQGGLAENSIFMVRGSGIGSIKSFRVFNRWGQIVFERSNFPPNAPAYGWNGKVNGVLAEPGVFVYTAEVICDNGIPYFYKGNVTLIR